MPTSHSARLLGVVFLLLMSASTHAAVPAPPPPPPCPVFPKCETCRTLCIEGWTRFYERDFNGAAQSFKEAYEKSGDPGCLFNLALVLEKAERQQDAAMYYEKYLKSDVANSEMQKRKAKEFLERPRMDPTTLLQALPDPSAQKQPDVRGALRKGTTLVHRKWWFWALIGAAAGSIALGVGLGVSAQRPDVSGFTSVRPFAN